MTLAEIRDELAHIVERRGSDTSAEERLDLLVLDDLRGELDVEEADHADEVEVVVELRGRIEMLMDQIESDLGAEPPPPAASPVSGSPGV